MQGRPKHNVYVDSPRGDEVVRMVLDFERKDFNWHRSDSDTFRIDIQMFVKYKLSDSDMMFVLNQQPGTGNYKEHANERNAYAEMMRGMEKLRRLQNMPVNN